ncbi:thiaminase II [Schnuerera sp. xch1]|uniref:thiaminase II n=1 Tax=Schnuerera sp. xch1 TaxID=2874283 RepID=UPI001CC13F3F|nr:thiaminase II [Schnuerera sp. xch1]MBZ2174465.1 thiaminase II [Schnuerera sp. xch1]
MIFEDIVRETEDIWKKVINNPMVSEIYNGTLDRKIFKFYLLQDYYYLDQSLRNMGILVSRAENIYDRIELINILYMEANHEFTAYEKLLKSLNIDLNEAKKVKLTRANVSYTNFLLSISSLNTFAEGIASLLPCYWTYRKIGELHQSKLVNNNDKYYQDWVSICDTPDFLELVDKMIKLLNRNILNAGKEKEKKIINAFSMSLKFEYEFWEDVYKMREWI